MSVKKIMKIEKEMRKMEEKMKGIEERVAGMSDDEFVKLTARLNKDELALLACNLFGRCRGYELAMELEGTSK